MPTYVYQCKGCGSRKTDTRSMFDVERVPVCCGAVVRDFSSVQVCASPEHLKEYNKPFIGKSETDIAEILKHEDKVYEENYAASDFTPRKPKSMMDIYNNITKEEVDKYTHEVKTGAIDV